MSIVTIIQKLEKNKKIKNILLSTSTTSSAKIFKKLKLKKTSHVYFPVDNNLIVKRYINYWKHELAIFIESEIWPNMINNLHIKNNPIIIIPTPIIISSSPAFQNQVKNSIYLFFYIFIENFIYWYLYTIYQLICFCCQRYDT